MLHHRARPEILGLRVSGLLLRSTTEAAPSTNPVAEPADPTLRVRTYEAWPGILARRRGSRKVRISSIAERFLDDGRDRRAA